MRKGVALGKTTVFDVANYFLSCVNIESGSLMTHLKLQKLCYYAQAWHLVFSGRPMFDQHFEAWAHGPVCPELWQAYKSYGSRAIPGPRSFDATVIDQEKIETLKEVWSAYGQFDAKYLEDLTHQEDPWLEARGSCPPGEACTNVISHESMKRHYASLLEDG